MNSLGGTWLGPANFRPVVFIKLPPRAGSSVGTRLYVHSMVRLYMHMGEFSTRGIDRLAGCISVYWDCFCSRRRDLSLFGIIIIIVENDKRMFNSFFFFFLEF